MENTESTSSKSKQAGRVETVVLNSYGLKGQEPSPQGLKVTVLGGAFVYGDMSGPENFVSLMKTEGVDFLNGGETSNHWPTIVSTYHRLKVASPDMKFVYVPTREDIDPSYNEATWSKLLSEFAVADLVGIATLPFAVLDMNGSVSIPEQETMSTSEARDFHERAVRYNSFLRQIASQHSVALVDLYEFLRPTSPDEISRDFSSLGELRPSSYGKVAHYFSTTLSARLSQIVLKPSFIARLFGKNKATEAKQVNQDEAHNIYPLW